MFFIGQSHIMSQLQFLLPHLYKNENAGMCMLFRGPSGWGKTRMSLMVCNYLTGGRFKYYLGDKVKFDDNFRVHFIDEVHLMTNPEIIYPKIDSGKFVIILATNDVAILPEALVNRSQEFIFNSYTNDELREMALGSLSGELPLDSIDYLIFSSGNNPRIIKNLCSKLNILLIENPNRLKDVKLERFKEILKDVFGIQDGLDTMCIRYLETLASLGGTASLMAISSNLHIDVATIRYFIEPILMSRKKLKISSKGRSLIQ